MGKPNNLGCLWVAVRNYNPGEFIDFNTFDTTELESRRRADRIDEERRLVGLDIHPVVRFVEVDIDERVKPLIGQYSEARGPMTGACEKPRIERDLCVRHQPISATGFSIEVACLSCPGEIDGYAAAYVCNCEHHRFGGLPAVEVGERLKGMMSVGIRLDENAGELAREILDLRGKLQKAEFVITAMVIQQGGEVRIPNTLLSSVQTDQAEIERINDTRQAALILKLTATPSCRECGATIPAGFTCAGCNSQPICESAVQSTDFSTTEGAL